MLYGTRQVRCNARIVASMIAGHRLNGQHARSLSHLGHHNQALVNWFAIETPLDVDGEIADHYVAGDGGRFGEIRRLITEREWCYFGWYWT